MLLFFHKDNWFLISQHLSGHTCTHLCIWIKGTIDFFFFFLTILLLDSVFCYHLTSSSPPPLIDYSFIYSVSSSHTFTGGLSLVGIHQGPSLSPATLQSQRTMSGQRQSSLLVCGRGWLVCGSTYVFNHAYYIWNNTEMQVYSNTAQVFL